MVPTGCGSIPGFKSRIQLVTVGADYPLPIFLHFNNTPGPPKSSLAHGTRIISVLNLFFSGNFYYLCVHYMFNTHKPNQ